MMLAGLIELLKTYGWETALVAGAVVIVIGSVYYIIKSKFETADTKIDGVKGRLSEEIKGVGKQIEGTEKTFTAKIEGVGKQIEGTEKTFAAKIEGVEKQIDGAEKTFAAKIEGVEKQINVLIELVKKKLNEPERPASETTMPNVKGSRGVRKTDTERQVARKRKESASV